ncbi:MAG: hypothetical protein A3I68_01580 [Candidatus Melainabacteria bacterium RIFCSPLOWO2_02_FULL_35_15]|nr:MAG: hypothetical protein A3F80_04890 [Candidatus Melainabacteria bacterium RIFCSPLOWO2_12_FULL_35_11]OGI13001.1 MAG: hypothetical protein A3I68_01580 [Candidatus Melainabacteria bacterium RIFCSPLOWO2_02_FULL_35_15]
MTNECGFVYCDECKEYHDPMEFVIKGKSDRSLRQKCNRARRIKNNRRRLARKMKEPIKSGQLMLDLGVNNEMV